MPFREVPGTFPSLVADLGLLALGLAVYGALFAFVGAYFKRPLVIGLVFTFGWEPTVMVLPGYLKQFTVAYYLQALVPHAMPSEGMTSLLQGFFRETPSLAVSLFWLAVYAARLPVAGHPRRWSAGNMSRAMTSGRIGGPFLARISGGPSVCQPGRVTFVPATSSWAGPRPSADS